MTAAPESTRIDRRRVSGTFGYVSCPGCTARFVIAGKRADPGESLTSIVVCPECGQPRPLPLPREVVEPFRIVTSRDAMRRDD